MRFQTSVRNSIVLSGIAIVAIFLLQCFLQDKKGVFAQDLAGDPDEAAHAVTALMLTRYAQEHFGENPVPYFLQYYEQFSKVALGHYPPFYYGVMGTVLLCTTKISSLLLAQSFWIASILALLLWVGAYRGNWGIILLAAVAWIHSAPVQKVTYLVLSDLLLVLMCLLALVSFARYLQTTRSIWSLAFGCCSALAILTKGSAWLLSVVPLLAIVATAKWRLLLRPSLWVAVLPVALLALPWQLYSLKITREGMQEQPLFQYAQKALSFYLEAWSLNFGYISLIALSVIAVAGIYQRFKMPMRIWSAVLWSGWMGSLMILLLIPAGLSSRYLLFIALLSYLLIADGIASFVTRRGWKPAIGVSIFAVLLAIQLGTTQSPWRHVKQAAGFNEAILWLNQNAADLKNVMICSDPRGEGAMIAAAAFHDEYAKSSHRFLRASKHLADIDWLGRGQSQKFDDVEQLRTALRELQVNWVLIDQSITEDKLRPFEVQLYQALAAKDSGWQIANRVAVRRENASGQGILIYHLVP